MRLPLARLFVVLLPPALFAVAVNGCGTETRPGAASDGENGNGYQQTGPCSIEGQTSTCHVETGRSGSIVNCFSGTQTCTNGAWGPCGDGAGTLTSVDVKELTARGGLSPLAVTSSSASPDAGGCSSNPCNPNCLGIDTDAGSLKPDGGIISVAVVGSLIDYSSYPTAKKAAMSSPTCTMGSPPANYQGCNYDYCCARTGDAGTTGTCQKWVDEPATCVAPAARDFTTGVGCKDASGVSHIPVCNRGLVAATTGSLLLAGYPGNPNAAGSVSICQNPSSNNPPEGCLIDLAVAPIPAGKCIDVNVARAAANLVPGIKCNSASDFGNGNRTSMVNPPGTNFSNLPNLGAGNYTQLAEADTCNDYSFVYTQTGSCATYGIQPPPPATDTFRYTATCPVGSRPVWNQFAYSTQVPSVSQVVFTGRTAQVLADGGTGAFGAPVTLADVQSGAGDPAICTMGGSPAGCPKSLTTLLGNPGATYPVLEIGVTLTATTAIPTVGGWQVSYSCVPNE